MAELDAEKNQRRYRKLRFNCYLLRDDVKRPELALRSPYRPGGLKEMAEVSASGIAPTGTRAFFGDPSGNPPPWARTLSAVFPELVRAVNLSNRFVIFLPVEQRWFAVCFGYGSSTLEWSKIEANFGLRFAARRMNPESLREVRTRRIGDTNRIQSVHLPSGGGLADLDAPLDGEFVRRLAGALDSKGVAFDDIDAIAATDAISFRAEADLGQIQEILGKMLAEVDSRAAVESLEFVDCLEPLRASSDQVRGLDELVAKALFEGLPGYVPPRESVCPRNYKQYIFDFSLPDINGLEDVDVVRLYRNDQGVELRDLTINAMRDAVGIQRGRLTVGALDSIKLMAFDSNGEPKSPKLSLRNWLIFEGGDASTRYILTLGRWFGLSNKFTERLDEDLRQIPDVTQILALPRWRQGWDEGKYNKEVAKGAGDVKYVVFDKVRIDSSDGDMIESCDLLHEDGHLIHVKKYKGATELSHLFSQGFVSAYHLRGDDSYKAKFIGMVELKNREMLEVAKSAPRSVVYAIGISNNREIPGGLPSFSKVNLREFARRIRGTGARAATCRVIMD